MPMLLLVGFLTRGPLGRIPHVSSQCNPSLNNVYNNNNNNNNNDNNNNNNNKGRIDLTLGI